MERRSEVAAPTTEDAEEPISGDDDDETIARTRFKDFETIRSILDQQAKRYGKYWVAYSETGVCKDAPTVEAEILVPMNLELLQALHSECGKLSFVRSDLQKIASALADKYAEADDWKLNFKFKSAYAKAIAARVMNLCHVVEDATKKSRPPKWTNQLPWRQIEETSAKPSEGDGELQYTFCFEVESLTMTRKLQKKKKGKPEPSRPLVDSSDANGLDMVVATWPDGFQKEIAELTYARLRELLSGGADRPQNPSTWTKD